MTPPVKKQLLEEITREMEKLTNDSQWDSKDVNDIGLRRHHFGYMDGVMALWKAVMPIVDRVSDKSFTGSETPGENAGGGCGV